MRAPDFWYPGEASRGGLPALLLSPLAACYDLAGRLRRGTTAPVRVEAPVLCVGNLVAGGAGKTPVVIDLARRLTEAGRQPHLISRGYGGRATGPLQVDPARHDAAEVGDEPLLLAAAAPTWVARDRVAGAQAALAARAEGAAGADCLILDDGFQNPALAKDLSLLVVDPAVGFGNERVMPAGPLREAVHRGLARSDGVVLLGEAEGPTLPPGLPRHRARLVPGPEAEALRRTRVLAFAGIGRPTKFFETLTDLGAEVVATRPFPDHHPYDEAEIRALLAEAESLAARPVTTEKDAVRLPAACRAEIATLSVAVAWQDETALARLLARLAESDNAERLPR